MLGLPYSIHQQPWPKWDAGLTHETEITLVVQVNGKLRDRIAVAAGSSDDEIRKLALASPKVQAHTEGREMVKIIVIGGKLVNLVVR